jgi:hypothetical protein
VRNVLTSSTVTPRRAPDKDALLIQQAYGRAIKLRLRGEFKLTASLFLAGEPIRQAPNKIEYFLFAERVFQGKHGNLMLDFRETACWAAADALGRRIRGNE